MTALRKPSPHIQRADPRARTTAIWILLVSTVFGSSALLVYFAFEADIHAWLERHIEFLVQQPSAILPIGLLMASPILIGSGFVFLYGYRVTKAKRVPLPDHPVIRDTKIYVGSAAARRGYLLQFLAAVLLLLGVSIPFMLWWVFSRLVSAGMPSV